MYGKEPLVIGDMELYWLHGGNFRLDGGAVFGAVPKALWGQRCSVDAENTLLMCNDPLLIKTAQSIVLVDTGLGNKLSEKQKAIYQVVSTWDLPACLEELGIAREEVTHVILTHGDFDHAGGVAMLSHRGRLQLTFPRAKHYLQKEEWEDIKAPHPRAKSVYLPEDFSLLQNSNLELLDGDGEICPGIYLRFSGGHTRGHQIVEIRSAHQVAVHLGDLFPSHLHANPLWVMAYDNYPLTVIRRKIEYFTHYSAQDSWFTFYHDPSVRACRLDCRHKVKDIWPLPLPNARIGVS